MHCLNTSSSLPTSLALTNIIQLTDFPVSVCELRSNIYVGLLNGKIVRVDSEKRINNFLTLSGTPVSICIIKNKLYVLHYGFQVEVLVYDLLAQRVAEWSHSIAATSNSEYSFALAAVSEKLIVADGTNKKITVYSTMGEMLKEFPCDDAGDLTVCSFDNSSFIVSYITSARITRMDITTGKVLWTYTDLRSPSGLSCLSGRFVAVASYDSRIIAVLDSKG